MVDVLIRNGKVIDGSGAAAEALDVLVEGGRIIEVGRFAGAEAEKVIEAAGRVVCPGFIDMHSHEDGVNTFLPEAESFAAQGITTAVTGNCGISVAPTSAAVREQAAGLMGAAAGLVPFDAWSSFGSYLDFVTRQGISINVFPLVGQGAVRAAVMGQTAARPTEEQMQQMQELVIRCMEEGAGGISTGLIYPPGSYASTEELVEVTRPVGKRGGMYFSHVRGESASLLEAIEEEITIGRRTGAALEHSHYKAAQPENWDKAALGLEKIDAARASGVDMTIDMYPYTAGSTLLAALLPGWAQEGGLEEILRRAADAQTRRRMTASMNSEGDFRISDWSRVTIPTSANPEHVGRSIAELAQAAGRTGHEWIFDALIETRGAVAVVLHSISEDNVKMQMRHPAMMFGTDGFGMPFEGPLATGAPHPRSFGTFPRILGRYVREEGVIPLEEAIWKMTGFPAQRLRLKERGLVRKGYKADLVVFDPQTVIDKADFSNPFQRPAGIEAVMVNGVMVMEKGVHTGARPGVITTRE